MQKIQIDKNFFNNYRLDYNFGCESIRFYDENYIYKIIKDAYLKDDRQKIIELLEHLNSDKIAKPISCLYDKSNFIGYSMKYYKDYQHRHTPYQKDNIY